MSEKDIRDRLRKVIEVLDAEARDGTIRRGVRGAVFPLILGAGLAVVACEGDETGGGGSSTSTSTSGTGGTGGTTSSSSTGSGTSSSGTGGTGGAGGVGAAGGAGGSGGAGGAGGNTGGIGGTIQPPYMAPDA